MKRNSRRGVTLLELLIVITLSSLLSLGILYSMHVGVKALERTNDRLAGNRRVVGAHRILEHQIAGLMPVAFQCGNVRGETSLFFQGETNSMRLVSSYSLEEAARGYPRILEYLVIPGADGQGVRLVVNELHYSGPASLQPMCAGGGNNPSGAPNLRPVELGPRPFVVADQLAFCRLSYLVADPRNGNKSWIPRFFGRRMPEAVRLEMAPLAPDPSRLQMNTMTVPVRAGRIVEEPLADIEEQ